MDPCGRFFVAVCSPVVNTAESVALTVLDQDPATQSLTISVHLASSRGADCLWVSFHTQRLRQYLSRTEFALVSFVLGDPWHIYRFTEDFEHDYQIELQLEEDFPRQLEQEQREIRNFNDNWEVDSDGHFVPVSPPWRSPSISPRTRRWNLLDEAGLSVVRQAEECPTEMSGANAI